MLRTCFSILLLKALLVCNAFLSNLSHEELNGPRPFVYVSAEDIFRPFIPARYIETKREAELGIENMVAKDPNYRAVFVRPSVYLVISLQEFF